jgi:hypothetical protein
VRRKEIVFKKGRASFIEILETSLASKKNANFFRFFLEQMVQTAAA